MRSVPPHTLATPLPDSLILFTPHVKLESFLVRLIQEKSIILQRSAAWALTLALHISPNGVLWFTIRLSGHYNYIELIVKHENVVTLTIRSCLPAIVSVFLCLPNASLMCHKPKP